MKIILDQDQIQSIVKQVGSSITGFDVVLCTLSGAVPFFSDLIKHMEGDFEVDYIKATSYGSGTVSQQCLVKGPFGDTQLRDKRILVVEDIIDTGKTIKTINDHLTEFGCKDITFLSLLKRKDVVIPEGLVGFYCAEVDQGNWLVGYGLDEQNKKRNLPYICSMAEN